MEPAPAELAELLAQRILVIDGAMGTMIQQADLGPDDFGGAELEGCNENLVLTRPDVIQEIHGEYLAAGADIVETNTFGATSLVLAEYDLSEKAYEINVAAAQLARAACDAYATPQRPRFAAGAIGPTTKALTVTGGTTFGALIATYEEQTRGLIAGGVDLLIVETTQDTLNMKAASIAIEAAFEAAGKRLPVILSATIEPMGTMLAGQGIDAWYTAIAHLKPLAVGMNCATGPDFMTDHVRTLADLATCNISVYPNAGLPNEDGEYDETPETLAKKIERFVDERWVNLVGGCCGTTPDHIRAIAAMVDGRSPRVPKSTEEPAVSGIERAIIDKENRPILVGERTNVIGSLRFKRLIEGEEWEKASEVGRAQVKRGAQIVDICLSHTDRDEIPDVDAFYPQVVRKVKVPLMIDSTDADAIEAALRHSQGKAIVNSINLEDGEERFETVCPLLRRYGAAAVVGTIDEDPEQGMAVSAERKLAVARRSHELLTSKYGMAAEDIIFDPLVFPCGTGDEAYVGSAGETVEGVRLIAEHFPQCSTILGVSNVSFGLPEAGREVLNSVFLHDCVQAGLTFAIVNTQGLERYPDISEIERQLCRNLLYNKGADPLGTFVNHFRGKKAKRQRIEKPAGTVEERLAFYVVEGTKEWLIEDLDELLPATAPLDIINGPLMKGMAEVGRLFGANELIVAEVLQSAEVMKAAVNHLEQFMDKADAANKGTIILATVKGDVHDIGKNLVDIILSNNGYRVIDLGIKVPPERLLAAYREHKPDAIGLSGLLVKSAQQMVVTAQDLHRNGVDVPLLVGGAALSAKFTATRIAPAYEALTLYAREAMEGLAILDRLNADPAAVAKDNRREQDRLRALAPRTKKAAGPVVIEPLAPHDPIAPPDYAKHVRRGVEPTEIYPWINPKMLYGKHMGLRGNLDELLSAGDERATGLHAVFQDLMAAAPSKGWLMGNAVWRHFPAQRDGDDLIIYDPDNPGQELERFNFARQTIAPGRCLSDYVHSVDSGIKDNVALFATTAGHGVRDQARAWKDAGEYVKSHALQALALECAEGLAELVHADIRAGWGFDDAGLTKKDIFQARFKGCRYSFGYPACPDLADQEKLWRLIDPTEIGIELTEGHMMDPEGSVSAIVFHHPEATYFAVE